MKIFITGASGRLGSELSKLYPDALKPTHKELPVEDKMKIMDYVADNTPDIVIHLAAATSIPKCEHDKELAWKTNVMGTSNLIDACEKYSPKCYFVLMSTPCVFNGEDENPKDEFAIPYPESF